MIDILYPDRGRFEFSSWSLSALGANTDWRIARLVHVKDNPAGPVAVMNDYLAQPGSEIFAKIDNDVIVPPGWLEAAVAVMEARPELGLLGIEPPMSRTPAPWKVAGAGLGAPELEKAAVKRGYGPCQAIGGIGLMRRSAFLGRGRMTPHGVLGVGGFTDWQWAHPEVIKGWIAPPLKVFLLDRLPIEPFASLSNRYIAEGVQRPWTNYDPANADLWRWWTDQAVVEYAECR